MPTDNHIVLVDNLYKAALQEIKHTYLDPKGIADLLKSFLSKQQDFQNISIQKVALGFKDLNKVIDPEDSLVLLSIATNFRDSMLPILERFTNDKRLYMSEISEEISLAINIISTKLKSLKQEDPFILRLHELKNKYHDNSVVINKIELLENKIHSYNQKMKSKLTLLSERLQEKINHLLNIIDPFIKKLNSFEPSMERDAVINALTANLRIIQLQSDLLTADVSRFSPRMFERRADSTTTRPEIDTSPAKSLAKKR